MTRKNATVCEVFKLIAGQGPQNIRDMFNIRETSRNLRSNVCDHLVVPRTRTMNADRDFAVWTVKYWESLPDKFKGVPNIDQFKKALKTNRPFEHGS